MADFDAYEKSLSTEEQIEKMREGMKLATALLPEQVKFIRKKYLLLLEEGFTPPEAIQLAKLG